MVCSVCQKMKVQKKTHSIILLYIISIGFSHRMRVHQHFPPSSHIFLFRSFKEEEEVEEEE